MELLVNTDGLLEEMKKEISIIFESWNQDSSRYREYLTTEETRAYLGGISTNSLTKLRRKGLKRVTIDGLCLYKKTDIIQFLDENKY
ncbi:helix-turn-helix domain-containing protein [Enterococcus mundtii]|uniref:helix-turn-helix domain-containing protein n=1 Tax=Enterococcus mundtii TaxID=53346 RepID=UPI0004450777|nr:helix-turn-helix domain-containing protein [Enterococcus mundtii]EYT95075.1 hypothetical protein AK89_10510 [Enterococcus mundtii CRL35]HCT4590707.1 helix-turn-helix domain-containing protein [Enterococcus faecalis]